MAKLKWSYHRPGWTSCGRTQEFLAKAGIEAAEEINAKKLTLAADQAIELASEANELYVAKGKKVVHVNLKKDHLSEEELLNLMLGPTGNLRAPTLVVGKKLIVGFNQDMYEGVFK